MIKASVTPGRLVVGRPAQLEIRFANVGGGPCANIVFTLGLPCGASGSSAAGGGSPSRRSRQAVTSRTRPDWSVGVADKAGDFRAHQLKLSYRGRGSARQNIMVSDWSAPISAEAPRPEPPRVARPAPRLRVEQVEHEGAALAVDEWGKLEILIRNPSDAPVVDVAVAIDGPFEAHRKSFPVAELDSGRAIQASVQHQPESRRPGPGLGQADIQLPGRARVAAPGISSRSS